MATPPRAWTRSAIDQFVLLLGVLVYQQVQLEDRVPAPSQ
jgi:hypothetical protein